MNLNFSELKELDLSEKVWSLIQRGLDHAGYYEGTFRGRPAGRTEAAYEAYIRDMGDLGKDLGEHESGESNWMKIAKGEIGVKEFSGTADNPEVVKYLKSVDTLSPQFQMNDETPWSGAFVNWCVEKAGYKGTESPVGRSWLKWGDKLEEPKLGCIVILKSRSSNILACHVGFLFRETTDDVFLLGGNQSDEVNITRYPKEKVLEYRWPKKSDRTAEVPALSQKQTNDILFTYRPKGASNKTARQDKLPQRGIEGVKASEAMAQIDRNRVMRFKSKFEAAAKKFNLPPALLAAIASRETRGGNVLDKKGFGDFGHGFGIMQVDDRNRGLVVAKEGGPFGQPHIDQATGILKDKLKRVKETFPNLTESEQLQTAVSRYNGGRGKAAPNSDIGTTGRDYMNDTWARARYYSRVEQWS